MLPVILRQSKYKICPRKRMAQYDGLRDIRRSEMSGRAIAHPDLQCLNARLRQNTVQEKLSNLWLDYLLMKQKSEEVA
ncbi:MAG: hypothetical protein PHI13_02985 [Methylococcales bacterium]|nr:hypothetical protein [Methylococcales bacterium]